MNYRYLFPLLLIVVLSACAPKYHYVSERQNQPAFDHIIVVFDYLHMVDDVGKLMDYPADINQQQLLELEALIETTLRTHGFTGSIDFALISSGLGLNPEMGFEHYLAGKKQEELIYPPFHLSSPHHPEFQQQLIQSFADAQQVAFTPVSKDSTGYFAELRMNSLDLNTPESWPVQHPGPEVAVAVLHIRAVYPRVSFMKSMGVSLLTAGLTAGVSGGAYVSVATPTGVPHSTALLFDNQSGEVIWKNQIPGDLSRFGEQGQKRFFKALPAF
jgi:hypothetical protein